MPSYLRGTEYTAMLAHIAACLMDVRSGPPSWVFTGGAARHLLFSATQVESGAFRGQSIGDGAEHKDIDVFLFRDFPIPTVRLNPRFPYPVIRTTSLGYSVEFLRGFYFDHDLLPTPEDVVQVTIALAGGADPLVFPVLSPEFMLVSELCLRAVRDDRRFLDVGAKWSMRPEVVQRLLAKSRFAYVSDVEIMACSTPNEVLSLSNKICTRIQEAHPWRKHLEFLPLQWTPMFADLPVLERVQPPAILDAPYEQFLTARVEEIERGLKKLEQDSDFVRAAWKIGLALALAPLEQSLGYYASETKNGRSLLQEIVNHVILAFGSRSDLHHMIQSARELHCMLARYDAIFRAAQVRASVSLEPLHARVAGALLEAQCLYWKQYQYRWDLSIPVHQTLTMFEKEVLPECKTEEALVRAYDFFGRCVKTLYEGLLSRNQGEGS